jgi:nucleolar protein 58
MRGIRSQLSSLISGISTTDYNSMVLGLSHSLSRYKLKFSPDKVDTMIIQAIHLLDDLDKELNTYAMRVKEWYGWHFPEMTKIIVDNIAYAKCVLAIGFRSNTASTNLSTVLPEDLETELKAAAQISMGTEISDSDIENIHFLCEQVVSISEYRAQLFDYLKNRMAAIAPNLTAIVGEIVGAKLIAHAGSLMSLAKSPASTVQILGAEKALFRALKTKHDTPKYGLIYHASLVGQAAPKNKGKMARIIATKATLALRVDALAEFGEDDEPTMGIQQRAKAETRLRQLEGKATIKEYSGSGKKMAGQKKFEITPAKSYNPSNDMDITSTTPAPVVKKKRKEKKSDEEEIPAASKKRKTVDEDALESEKKRKKSKKSKTSE